MSTGHPFPEVCRDHPKPRPFGRFLLAASLCIFPGAGLGRDQPQWGFDFSRNQISTEQGLPADFDPATGRNIRWVVPIGTESHGTPVVAKGRVYIGTNNEEPRDARHQGDRGVLMCLDERTGGLLWQLIVPKREEDPYMDWPKTGMSSTPTVEGNRVYMVSNRGEVLCLDARGQLNGNQGPFLDEARHQTPTGTNAVPPIPVGRLDGDILWNCDLVATAGIWPHDAAHSSILAHGEYLYINTGSGVDNTHRKIRRPDAPSLVVIHKTTGRLVAQDDEHIGPRIFHCTWSSPSLGRMNGSEVVFFAGGDGILYAFEPVRRMPAGGVVEKLARKWRYDPDPAGPKEDVHRYTTNRREGPSSIYGFPVWVGGRVFLAGGGDWWWGKNEAWLKCVEPGATASQWSFPLEKHTLSSPAVADGLAYIADSGRNLHCVDAITGSPVWTQSLGGEVWASPMVADGKVYLGTRRGDFWIMAAGREKKVLHQYTFPAGISGTTTIANRTVYVATMTHLHALALKP